LSSRRRQLFNHDSGHARNCAVSATRSFCLPNRAASPVYHSESLTRRCMRESLHIVQRGRLHLVARGEREAKASKEQPKPPQCGDAVPFTHPGSPAYRHYTRSETINTQSISSRVYEHRGKRRGPAETFCPSTTSNRNNTSSSESTVPPTQFTHSPCAPPVPLLRSRVPRAGFPTPTLRPVSARGFVFPLAARGASPSRADRTRTRPRRATGSAHGSVRTWATEKESFRD
jgi:hypothetical protein